MYELTANINLTITIQKEGVTLPIVHVTLPFEDKAQGRIYRAFMTEEEIASFESTIAFALFVIENGVRIY
jgi:hypothetical protein